MLSPSTAPSRGSGALFTARARHLLAIGRADEVVEICTRGLARFPENVGGYILLAEAYRLLGQPERSRNVLADGVRRTRSNRLRALLEAGDRTEEREARSEENEEQSEEPVDEVQEIEATVEDASVDVAEEEIEEPAVVDEPEATGAEESIAEVSHLGLPDSGSEEIEESVAETVPLVEDAAAVVVEEVAVAADEESSASLPVEESVAPPVVEQPVETVKSDRPAPAASQPAAASTIAQPSTPPISLHVPKPQASAPQTSEPESRNAEPEVQTPTPPARLSLHVRSAPAPKLRSSNLRLIPGLEFAPLRHEENSRQRQIAPLIDDAMPEPSLPELLATTDAEPAVAEVETVPPMPAFSESGAEFQDSDSEENVLGEVVESVADVPDVEAIPVPTTEEGASEPSIVESTASDVPAIEASAPAVPDVSSEKEEIGTSAATAVLAADKSALESIEVAEVDEADVLSADATESAVEVESPSSDPEPQTPDLTSPDPEFRTPEPVFHRRQLATDNQPAMTPLEELARKLESARIPIIEESNEPPRPVFEPSLVSDTIAEILVRQGAWAEAMKAFQMLARMKPGKHAHYQERIREMRERIAAESGPPLPDHLSTEP